MNNSGQSIKSIIDYYKISIKNIIIIHDDIDLNLGEIKYKKIVAQLGTKEFNQLLILLALKILLE